MKKKTTVVLLAMVMMMASVLVVNAVSEEWSDDWRNAPASANGSASCTADGADVDSMCLANGGTVISTRTSVSASFDYKNMETGALYTESDYDTDGTFSNVEFSAPNNCEGFYLAYSYSAGYTAYDHGVPYDEDCSGNGGIWAEH